MAVERLCIACASGRRALARGPSRRAPRGGACARVRLDAARGWRWLRGERGASAHGCIAQGGVRSAACAVNGRGGAVLLEGALPPEALEELRAVKMDDFAGVLSPLVPEPGLVARALEASPFWLPVVHEVLGTDATVRCYHWYLRAGGGTLEGHPELYGDKGGRLGPPAVMTPPFAIAVVAPLEGRCVVQDSTAGACGVDVDAGSVLMFDARQTVRVVPGDDAGTRFALVEFARSWYTLRR